jgi:uncharacterized membrane protein YqjE
MDRPSLFQSLRSVASTAVDIVESRLCLAVVELREAQAILLKTVAFAGLAVICLGLMLLFLAGLIVVAFWDTHRLAAVASLVGLFGSFSALLAWLTFTQLRGVQTVFGATRAQLAKDREELSGSR